MNLGNVLIMGDSYSTFEGYNPEGYRHYYAPVPRPDTNTDVVKVEHTWWHPLLAKTNANLILNNSWSGSTIGYTGYNGDDNSQTCSFIYRLRQLIAEGFFEKNKIDTVLVFGGTNDNWCCAPLGKRSCLTGTSRSFTVFFLPFTAIWIFCARLCRKPSFIASSTPSLPMKSLLPCRMPAA
jgi:hypothetical protein